MLNGISGLIAALAGLITAVTGLIGMVVVARRTSPRERNEAAQAATEQALNPPTQAAAQITALTEVAQHKHPRRRLRRGR